MKRRRGQAVVEFAFIAPMVFLMIFGMIYGGFMFIEYLHYSNEVRTVARQIAVTSSTDRNTYAAGRKTYLEKLYTESGMPAMYKPTVEIGSSITDEEKDEEGKVTQERTFNEFTNDSEEVVVEVSFYMEDKVYNSLPNILKNSDDVSFGVGFPPRSINAIRYRMKLENNS